MANFRPLKQYMLYCLDRCIARYNLTPPFLDIGCGRGDVSAHVAAKGWFGKAIDPSASALVQARKTLSTWTRVDVQQTSLVDVQGGYNTIFLWDVLEHIDDDEGALRKIASLLSPNGHLLISVPSNPREWRWDDEFYGHCRRYTVKDMREKLMRAGMRPILFWDFTYPVFWAMRRMYTRLKAPPPDLVCDKEVRTMESASVNAWEIPVISAVLSNVPLVWPLMYRIQFSCFRKKVSSGHEMFVLATRA